MKKVKTQQKNTQAGNMLPQYDFSMGVRGKHFKSMQKGYTVKVHREDGTTEVTYFVPSKTAVLLDKDVQEHFPDSKAVNRQLRACIAERRSSSPDKPSALPRRQRRRSPQ